MTVTENEYLNTLIVIIYCKFKEVLLLFFWTLGCVIPSVKSMVHDGIQESRHVPLHLSEQRIVLVLLPY